MYLSLLYCIEIYKLSTVNHTNIFAIKIVPCPRSIVLTRDNRITLSRVTAVTIIYCLWPCISWRVKRFGQTSFWWISTICKYQVKTSYKNMFFHTLHKKNWNVDRLPWRKDQSLTANEIWTLFVRSQLKNVCQCVWWWVDFPFNSVCTIFDSISVKYI